MHQDQAGGQAAQVLALQAERLDRRDQRLWQLGEQSRGLARIAVDEQPVDSEPLGAQPLRERRDVGFAVFELGFHHRIERRPIALPAQIVERGAREHETSVVFGTQIARRSLLLEVAGGEEAYRDP